MEEGTEKSWEPDSGYNSGTKHTGVCFIVENAYLTLQVQLRTQWGIYMPHGYTYYYYTWQKVYSVQKEMYTLTSQPMSFKRKVTLILPSEIILFPCIGYVAEFFFCLKFFLLSEIFHLHFFFSILDIYCSFKSLKSWWEIYTGYIN